jgi:hypothetical protein
MSKPIIATRGNCDHCVTHQVRNLVGKYETRYSCEFIVFENKDVSIFTYSKPCSMYDWTKCKHNEDK